jgi:predicted cobalt transporter CbtA
VCIGSDRLVMVVVVVVVVAGVVFGVPRPSRAASEGPRELPRGYLGVFGDALSLLLETRAFKIAPASCALASCSPR